MTQHDDAQLATWLAEGPAHGQPAGLERALSAAHATRQRPAWLVAATGGTIASERAKRSVGLGWGLVAVVALIGLLIGSLVVGGWLRPQPAPDAVLPSTTAVPSPNSEASPLPAGHGLIAYTAIEALQPGVDCTDSFVSVSCFRPRLWVSNADGTDAHELFPSRPGRQIAVAWSPDGSQLLFSEDSPPLVGLMLTDAAGSEPQLVIDATCEGVITCSDFDGATFSPDGTQIAFLRLVETGSVIATMDLATGSVVELESTRTTDEPSNGAPRWSPDGGRLIFERQATGFLGGRETNLFVVNADGSELLALTPNELFAIDPDWSPDGSSIVFLSSVPSNGEEEPFAHDIYTIGSDGTGARRLTTDGISVRPNWTADGRIVFVRVPTDSEGAVTAFELWVMNADGTGQTQLDADDLAALSGADCVICPYPPMDVEAEVQFLNDALWQPANQP